MADDTLDGSREYPKPIDLSLLNVQVLYVRLFSTHSGSEQKRFIRAVRSAILQLDDGDWFAFHGSGAGSLDNRSFQLHKSGEAERDPFITSFDGRESIRLYDSDDDTQPSSITQNLRRAKERYDRFFSFMHDPLKEFHEE